MDDINSIPHPPPIRWAKRICIGVGLAIPLMLGMPEILAKVSW